MSAVEVENAWEPLPSDPTLTERIRSVARNVVACMIIVAVISWSIYTVIIVSASNSIEDMEGVSKWEYVLIFSLAQSIFCNETLFILIKVALVVII